jgi:hypothetical protein
VREQRSNREWNRQGVRASIRGVDPLECDIQSPALRGRQSGFDVVRALRHEVGEPGERQPAVELSRGHRQDPTASALCHLARSSQQAALPHAGFPRHNHAAALRERRLQDRESVLAAEESE